MGNNATVLIRTDGAGDIRNNAQEFVDNLLDAVNTVASRRKIFRFSRGSHCNPAQVVEFHHADYVRIVAIGGNTGKVLGEIYDPTWPFGHAFALAAIHAIMEKSEITKEEI